MVVKRIIVGLFFLAIWLPLLQMKFSIFPDFQSSEKRKLRVFPVLENRSIDKWVDDFDGYFSDNFGFRRFLISKNNLLSAKVFGASAVPKVVIGQDGWLFYKSEATGDGPGINDYQGLAPLTPAELQTIKTDLETITATLSAKGIKFFVLIGPNKSSIYGQYLPVSISKARGITRFDQLKAFLSDNDAITLLDYRGLLQQPLMPYPTYYKTDTHWNDYGAFLVSQGVVEKIRESYPVVPSLKLSDYNLEVTYKTGFGDVATMLGLPEQFSDQKIKFLPKSPSKAEARIIQYSTDVGGTREINSQLVGGPKLLVFGDSYSAALQNFLPTSFPEALFITLGPTYKFRTDIVLAEQPDIVIWEVAERFLDHLHL